MPIHEQCWKVTEFADIPVKCCGGAGVGFHPFVNGETTLLAAAMSATGFERKQAKASVKGSDRDSTRAKPG